ncbi:hypothetical protein HDV05_007962 [Chytridiales sp. JEL 0842]|nr:hypothetical protein HDV05_007962 [Chytridiales sp. JEL 0842]
MDPTLFNPNDFANPMMDMSSTAAPPDFESLMQQQMNFVQDQEKQQKLLTELYRKEHEKLTQLTLKYFAGRASMVPLHEPEITYVSDSSGVIQCVEDRVWNEFIESNSDLQGMPHTSACLYPAIIGRSIFEFVKDPKVHNFFRHIMLMLASGAQKRYSYYWFCDSPEYERKMHMTVCRLGNGGPSCQLLWISKILEETPAAPVARYLSAKAAEIASEEEKRRKPTRTVCTFCKRILLSQKEMMTNLYDFLQSPPLTGSAAGCTALEDRFVHPHILPYTGSNGIPVLGMRGKLGQQSPPPTPPYTSSSASNNYTSPPPSSIPNHHYASPNLPSSLPAFTTTPSQQPTTPEGQVWCTPAEYYAHLNRQQMGAGLFKMTETPNDFLINHGMCEVCYLEIANLFFPQLLGPVGSDPVARPAQV